MVCIICFYIRLDAQDRKVFNFDRKRRGTTTTTKTTKQIKTDTKMFFEKSVDEAVKPN